MAHFTEHYDLIKPQAEDYYDVADFNENFDTIDAQMAQTAEEVEGVGTKVDDLREKVGTPAAGGTVFSLLEGMAAGAGVSVVKSIQRISYYTSLNDSGKGEEKIKTVDPAKCVVLMDRLGDDVRSGTISFISYTLYADKMTFSHATGSAGYSMAFQFQIIEFY